MIAYRDATAADAAMLTTLFADCFTATFGQLYDPADLAAFLGGFTAATWQAELAQPDLAIRLATSDGVPIGFAKTAAPTLPLALRGSTVELRQLYLREKAKGIGVASALMQWVIDRARTRGAVDLILSVYVDNRRARRFYERYGFEDVGPYKFMVGHHADEDRMMRMAL